MNRDDIQPVFFAYTRSFLLGVLPILLSLIDLSVLLIADPSTSLPMATLISWVVSILLPVSADQVTSVMQILTPICGLLIAQQRSGYARPYSLDPRAK